MHESHLLLSIGDLHDTTFGMLGGLVTIAKAIGQTCSFSIVRLIKDVVLALAYEIIAVACLALIAGICLQLLWFEVVCRPDRVRRACAWTVHCFSASLRYLRGCRNGRQYVYRSVNIFLRAIVLALTIFTKPMIVPVTRLGYQIMGIVNTDLSVATAARSDLKLERETRSSKRLDGQETMSPTMDDAKQHARKQYE